LYLKEGFQVLYLPIPDFGIPTKDDLERVVQQTIAYAQEGQHIVIHCSAGIGRTGLFMAYLAKQYLGVSGAEALQWVRRFIPHAAEALLGGSPPGATTGLWLGPDAVELGHAGSATSDKTGPGGVRVARPTLAP